jgi:hypothetical protein
MAMDNLWQSYRFLTREMAAFIAKQELDMFYELQNQRIQLQEMIDEQGAYGFLRTTEGLELVREVQQTDARISTQLRGAMNRLQQQRQVQNAYHASYSGPVGRQTDFSG